MTGSNFRFVFDFYPYSVAGPDKGVNYICRMIGGRKGPVATLLVSNGTLKTGQRLEKLHQCCRGKIVECWFDEVRFAADVGTELIPVLDIGKIAPALSGNHYLAARTGHLL